METTLHRQLKARNGPDRGGLAEVVVEGYRIDAIDPDGTLVEVQCAALGPLRGKLARLLPDFRVRVVKPVVVSRRIVRRARRDGPDQSARLSPRRGAPIDAFDDLIGLARLFPHPNLRIDVVSVAIDEIRVNRRRRPGFAIADRALREVLGTISLATADDLWSLLPDTIPDPFTTADLAEATGKPADFARRVAYCLRCGGAAAADSKRGNLLVYSRTPAGKALVAVDGS